MHKGISNKGHSIKFLLNTSVDTLPTAANLKRCKKISCDICKHRQTTEHDGSDPLGSSEVLLLESAYLCLWRNFSTFHPTEYNKAIFLFSFSPPVTNAKECMSKKSLCLVRVEYEYTESHSHISWNSELRTTRERSCFWNCRLSQFSATFLAMLNFPPWGAFWRIRQFLPSKTKPITARENQSGTFIVRRSNTKCSDRYYSDCRTRVPFESLNDDFELCLTVCQAWRCNLMRLACLRPTRRP